MISTMPVIGGGVQGSYYSWRRDLNEGNEERRNLQGPYGFIGTNGVVSTKYSDTQILWNSTVQKGKIIGAYTVRSI